ncbi:MAG: DUF1254 domain-containing protein [Hydrogenovibrio sp.]
MKQTLMKVAFVSLLLSSFSATYASQKLTAEEANAIAIETYIYGYPLVLSGITQDIGQNVTKPTGTSAPINQFGHMNVFPDASWTIVVRPNADTLYTTMGYDVTKEPTVISIPASNGRYYLLQFLDMWSDVFTVPGSRTTGDDALTFAIVGPNWQGQLPDNVREYRSPTGRGLLIGRTQTNGKADYKAVRAFQNGMKAVPLSAYGKPYTPPKGHVNPNQDMTAPPDQLDKMDAKTFFTRFAEMMKANPPHANDYPMIDRMKQIGIVPGESFAFDQAPKIVQQALNAAPKTALKQIKAAWKSAGDYANGWRTNMTAIGTYGTDYLHRAGVAYGGYGANVPQDAIYPTTYVDQDGKPLDSAKRYVLHFDKDRIPPINGFWSLTMYNERQLFAANPIHRYAIGDRDKLKFNADGSLDLYIQRTSPGKDKESNWLPTPAKGAFSLGMRLYWPKAKVLNGGWTPPGVKPVQ